MYTGRYIELPQTFLPLPHYSPQSSVNRVVGANMGENSLKMTSQQRVTLQELSLALWFLPQILGEILECHVTPSVAYLEVTPFPQSLSPNIHTPKTLLASKSNDAIEKESHVVQEAICLLPMSGKKKLCVIVKMAAIFFVVSLKS